MEAMARPAFLAEPLASVLPPMLESSRHYGRPSGAAGRRRATNRVRLSIEAADSAVAVVLAKAAKVTDRSAAHASTIGADASQSSLSDDNCDLSATAGSWTSGKDVAAVSATPRTRGQGLNATWGSVVSTGSSVSMGGSMGSSLSSSWPGRGQGADKLSFTRDGVAVGGHLRFADSCRVIVRGDFLEGLGEMEEDHRELAVHRWDISRETGMIHRKLAHKRLKWQRQRQQQLRAATGHRAAEAAAAPPAACGGSDGPAAEDADVERGVCLSAGASEGDVSRTASILHEASMSGSGERGSASPRREGSMSGAPGAADLQEAGGAPQSSRPSIMRHVKTGGADAALAMERQSSSKKSSSGAPLPTPRRSRLLEAGKEAAVPSPRRRSSNGSSAAGGGADGQHEGRQDLSSLTPGALVQGEGLFEDPEMKCILKRLKLKTGRENRLQRLTALQSSHVPQSRFDKLKSLRRRDFDALPLPEREAMKLAFEEEGSSVDVGALSAKQLKNALRSLGLRARSDAERAEIALLCNEVAIAGEVDFLGFVFETVPRARERLRELRRPVLMQHACLYDEENTGLLHVDQCTTIFERLCLWDLDTEGVRHMRQGFEEKLRKVRETHTGQVHFDDFEAIMSEVQEQGDRLASKGEATIERQEQLGEADMKAHRDELLQLHESFRRAATEAGRLPRQKLLALLMDHGLGPPDSSVAEKLEQIVEVMCEEADCFAIEQEESKPDFQEGHLRFKHVLQAVRLSRELIASGSHFQLSQMFARLDKGRRGSLDFPTIKSLLERTGMVPRHLEDQAEIGRLLAEANKNKGSGEVGFPEFEHLVLRVKQRIKAAQRFRAAKTAQELRFKDSEAADLRELFNMADTDGLGELTADQLDGVMEKMHRTVAAEDKQAIFARLVNGGPQVIDMEKFFRFVRAAAAVSHQG